MEKSAKRAILALSVVVVVLALVVVYALAIKPSINGYATKAYNQGIYDTVNSVVNSVSTNGYVQLPASNNQTLILVPYQQSQSQTTTSGSA